MASSAVTAAVTARLAAWTRAPVKGVNTGAEVPDDSSAFLTVSYPVATETQVTIGAPGSNVFREEGAIRFVLSVSADTGLDPYAGWMDELRALFRMALFGGVQTWEAPPFITDDRNDSGAYFNLSFSVAYRFDILA